MNFTVERQPMISGQGEVQRMTFNKYFGDNGRTWYVGDTEEAANHVYVDTHDPRSRGFGGSTLEFKLVDGTIDRVKGPWHSNADALYEETGVDVRDKHFTFIVISRTRDYIDGKTIMVDVIYQDDVPMLGNFYRGHYVAQALMKKLGLTEVSLYSQSQGGSSCGTERIGHDKHGNKLPTVEEMEADIANAMNAEGRVQL